MIDQVKTRVTGITVENHQDIVKYLKSKDIKMLFLYREPKNQYDPFAIAVKAKLFSVSYGWYTCLKCEHKWEEKADKCPKCDSPDIFPGKLARIGYIRNRGIQCTTCGWEDNVKAGQEIPTICSACGSETIMRAGLATELAKAMDNGVNYACEVLEYTGGETDKKTVGVNIMITKLEQ
jgi:predicted Zn-ribbon and HTH transcriptional regulator